MTIPQILNLVLMILVILVAMLGAIYALVWWSNNQKNKEPKKQEKKTSSVGGQYSQGSIYKFMEFDEIKDNMIVRKNKEQFVMVIQCQGVNYDLMSAQEKLAIEEGFVQFLNTLRYPIQLYVQTTSLNLKDIIEEYKAKVQVVEEEVEEIRRKMQYAKSNGEQKEYEELEFQERRKNNVLEYGQDITTYIQRLSLNKNVLQQKTYVVVSYYASEFDSSTYSKNEIESLCFSELYTRCQTIISSLGACEVTGRVLNSEELAELLYVAYNRDDAELIQVSKALDAEYDALYTTGKDVLEKRQELIEDQVMQDAVNLVTDSIITAEAKIKRRKEKKEQVVDAAFEMMEEYKDQVDQELYEEIQSEIEINAEDLEAEYEEDDEIEEASRPIRAKRK